MKKVTIILCMVIFCSAGILYFFLPQTIPIHVGLSGVDAYGNKASIFFFPVLSLIVTAAILLTRKIDPKKMNYKRFEKPFYTIIFTINLVLFGIMFLMAFEAFWPGIMNISLFLCVLLGGMFMLIGNLLPKFKANYMMGIRTPWTLASEKVWYQTHRFGGKFWFFGGLLFILAGFALIPTNILTTETYFYVMTIYILVLAIIPCIVSYVYYKKLNNK